MSKCIQTRLWLGGTLLVVLIGGCGLVPGAATDATGQAGRIFQGVGAMADELRASPGRATLASNRTDTPPPGYAADVARMMEMVKAMGGSDVLEDDEDDDEDRAEAMAAMQASDEFAAETSDATVSATEAELMAGLGGIPVKTGRVTPDELRQRLLAPPEKE